MNTGEIILAVNEISEQNPDYELIAVIGASGKSLASSDGKEHDFSSKSYFEQSLSGRQVIYGPLLSKNTGKIILGFSSPIKTNESVSAVILAFSSLDNLASKLAKSAPGLTGEVYLVDPNGYLMTPSRFNAELKQHGLIIENSVLELNVQSYATQQIQNGEEGTSEYRNYLGNQVMGAYTRLSELNWGLVVEQNTDEIFIEMKMESEYLVIFIVFLSAVSLILVIAATIRFVRKRDSNLPK
jgi:hypothetical protein